MHYPTELPTFNGDLSAWNADVENLDAALASPHGFTFVAQLPEIIGYMPEEERRSLTDLRGDQMYQVNEELQDRIPKTIDLLRKDVALVTNGTGEIEQLEIDRRPGRTGRSHRGSTLHIDSGLSSGHETAFPGYLMSDHDPTLFYAGPARVYVDQDGYLALRRGSLCPESRKHLVQAPPYAFVRFSFATIHASPKATSHRYRTFMRGGADEAVNRLVGEIIEIE